MKPFFNFIIRKVLQWKIIFIFTLRLYLLPCREGKNIFTTNLTFVLLMPSDVGAGSGNILGVSLTIKIFDVENNDK